MDKRELDFLLKEGEGYNLEFKESDSTDLAKEICAFANATGGKILVGVRDNGEVKGIMISNRLKSQIVDIARNFNPKLEISVEEVANVLIVHIPEGKNKPYSINGKFYLRYGPNSQQLERDEIREFFYKEGLILWDEQSNKEFNIEKDFNIKSFDHFIRLANFSSVLSRKELLQNLSLVEGSRMKNAGVLLFAKDITKFFQKAIITCVLYQGTEKVNIIDKKDFTRDLYSNYHDALDYLKSKLNTQIIITAGPHQKKLELPEKALREALVNAIGHRDYHVQGAKIMVEISLDRVEITNPGGLVKGLKREEFGKKSLSRNNLLFGLLQRIGLVENVGTGIRRMRELMKAEGLEEPTFEISEDWFVVIFKRLEVQKLGEKVGEKVGKKVGEKEGVRLTENQKKILELVRADKYITFKELSEKINMSEKNVYFNVEKLKKKDLLRRIGPAKGGHWEVK